MTSERDVTQLLVKWRKGDKQALERLMPLVYDELHQRAAAYLARERPGHTLQPTALVHEVFLRLVNQKNLEWANRAHFLGVAAQLMRLILVDHARAQRAAKRGGGAQRITLGEAAHPHQPKDVDLLALDEALQGLEKLDTRQSRIVELRYFGGLNIDETAEVMSISPATVKREWRMAKAWLHSRLEM